ncbi:hypothetical protein JXD38_06485 [candidate division WOR-3 bacterium]|nr:hypothetical protein [candidate division WOR-3 bacterium]
MSGSEPREPDGPDEKPQPSSSPPKLVFEPDERQASRIARIRIFTLLATVGLMVVALVLILSYRPPPVKLTDPEPPRDLSYATDSIVQSGGQTSSEPAPVSRRATTVDIAKSAVAAVDALVNAASDKWGRAKALSSQGAVTRDNAQEAAGQLQRAVILADSAQQDIRSASQQVERVRAASREAESNVAFRLSVLYKAMSQYLKSMADDADDRYAYYAKSEAAVEALLRLDGSEFEIQQNVAVSYLRKSEDRQASIRRLAEQMREALRNIENARR